MTQIEIRNLRIEFKKPKSEETFAAVDGVSLDIAQGEFVTIVGSSGCGKTTLLLTVAGLVPASAGSITTVGWVSRRKATPSPRLKPRVTEPSSFTTP